MKNVIVLSVILWLLLVLGVHQVNAQDKSNKIDSPQKTERITLKNEGRVQNSFELVDLVDSHSNKNLQLDEDKGYSLAQVGLMGSFTTKPIAINLKNPTPFISSYTTWKGKNLIDELLTIEQRISFDGKKWQDWEKTTFDGHVNIDNHKEAKRITSIASFLPKKTQFIQYRISWKSSKENNIRLDAVEVSFYSPGKTPKKAMKKAMKEMDNYIQSGGCSRPPVVSRSSWGARSSRSSYSYTDVTHLVVHHAFGYDWNDGAAAVRAVQDLHQNSNGWSDIGYNYLIHKSGLIYQGRPENAIGAHFCGYNARTQGICMLGTFTSTNPTSAAMTSLKKLLAWKAAKEGISPLGSSYHYSTRSNVKNIAGHRDGGGCTACPGNSLYALLPSVRVDVNSLIQNGCGGTPPPPPPPTGDTTPPTTSMSAPNTVSDNFTVTFTDSDNVGVVRRFYQVLESVNGEWRGNKEKGFYNDNFGNLSIHSDFTKGLSDWAGTWWETSEGRLRQSSLNSNTAMSTVLSQTQGNAYLYNFAAKVNNTSGARRFGMHIMASSQTQRERGNSYLVWFSTDAGKVYIYETINNILYTRASTSLTTNNSWADYKIAYSTNSGKIEVFKNGQPVLDWTDSSPLKSGSYISFRTNGASVDFDDLKVFKSRGTSQTVFVGTSDWNDIRVAGSPAAKIKSLVKDAAHNWSALGDKEVNVTSVTTKIAITNQESDSEAEVLQVFPNPVSGNSLNVKYSLKEASEVRIALYDILGKEAAIFYNGKKEAGNQYQEFKLPKHIKSGTYIIRIATNEGMKTIRLVKL